MQGLYSENVRICPRGWVRSAGSYPNLDKRRSFNAGTYTLVRRISVCVLCAGLTCAAVDYSAASYPNFDKRETFAAYAAAGHLLLSIATKVGKNAFCLSEQKALISAK